MNPENFRSFLHDEFMHRCNNNPSYSMRAFARDVGLSATSVCNILKGRQGLSRQRAEGISKKLFSDPNQAEYFCDLVEMESSRNEVRRLEASERVKLRQLQKKALVSLDAVEAMSHWYYVAILQLTEVKDFEFSSENISNRMGIPENHVIHAIDGLVKLGLLRIENNRYVKSNSFHFTPDGIPSAALRHLNGELIDLAKEALTTQNVEQRTISANIMSVCAKDFSKAQKMISEFRKKLAVELDGTKEKDKVYCLSVQFFDLMPGLVGKNPKFEMTPKVDSNE